MKGCLSQRDIMAFVDEDAPADQLAAWRRHLRICDPCATQVARLRAGIEPALQRAENGDIQTNHSVDEHPIFGLEPNLQLGDFLLERRLGAGGMGVVYQALQVSLNRHVALKVLPLGFAVDALAVERFRREARAAAKLRHPNIVTIFAEGAENTICYYAMEMIDGENLDQIIKNLRVANSLEAKQNTSSAPEESDIEHHLQAEGEIGTTSKASCPLRNCTSKREYFDTLARLISEVAEALDYAHSEGIIHRDVKPSNLMLTGDGQLVLLDFGVARICEERAMTLTGSFVGTPRYMSPEQIESDPKEMDHRSDIYSLGVTLYELLTLEPLFEGDIQEQIINQIINKEPLRPRQIDRRIPVDLETICCKAIEKEPHRRYQSAGEFANDLRRYLDHRIIKAKRSGPVGRLAKFVLHRKVTTALVSGIVLATVVAGSITWEHYTTQWAQQDAMAQIDRLTAQNKYFPAFVLAKRAERYIPDDPLLIDRWPRLSRDYSITTTPTGAKIFIGEHSVDSTGWEYLGRSPIEHARIPFGTHRWKVEKAGFISLEVIQSNDLPPPSVDPAGLSAKHIDFLLHRVGSFATDMVFIPSSEADQGYLWHGTRTIPSTPTFLIDKYEVTNRQFKVFVDSGGYQKPEYWQEKFVKDGETLAWSQAIQQFRDQTGSFGPAGWSDGTYPEGQADYPVGGISWYEASAYARFRGKHLPTIFHWLLATGANNFPYRVSPLSNFGDGPAPVGSHGVMSKFGLYDGAGNVREWCYNAIEGAEQLRNILGGAWGDPEYIFTGGELRSPWDRDVANGLRCVEYLGGKDAVPDLAFDPIEYKHRDFTSFKPVSDEVLDSYINTWYKYDRTELNARVESVDYYLSYCRRERITFDAAYPDERVIAYLHLPTGVKPPYQIVVWYPGGDARASPWDQRAYRHEMVAIMKSGRALIVPFYKGTYERRLEKSLYPPDGIQSRNLYIQRSQDMRRAIDYLQTRQDVDTDKLAYAGLSWGSLMGSVMIALEDRFKVGIFLLGGICACQRHPTSDPANFAPRVKIPILMINGTDDSIFPYETAQRPLFNLLGTPETHKKHIVFPGGHSIPWEYHKQCHREIMKWLDQYLGPVNRIDVDRKSEAEIGKAAMD
ncbi:MAG TPA: protein kinase [Sedimentisphaerales bacterium]|nr:protein kinase [Sedimentisphaerales bacterium]